MSGAQFKLVLGSAPSASAETAVLASLELVQFRTDALPVGKTALQLAGGKVVEKASAKKDANEFPEDRIQIPVGITPSTLHNFTLYDMLGFTPEWADSADAEAIKKAYHKAVLMYHPDKAQFKSADGKEDRTVFLKIQEAHNVLSNEGKRRAYDSQLPFDETIPSEERVAKALAKGPAKFFKLFDPVFKRNARFASKKPVPDLGDMDTPLPQVHRFYDYWVNFESWRDFTGVGAEHRPDEASSREEKRWMMKENERLAKKLKKKEMERLIALVAIAQTKDPRLVADREARKAAKDADKNAKEAEARRKAEEEAEAKAWAEAQEREVQARNELSKADREKLKKQQSNARNLLKKLLRASAAQGHGSGEYGIVTAADVELLCTCELEDLNIMNAAMGGAPASKDASLFLIGGAEEVLSRIGVLQERQTQAADDERIMKEAKKREQLAAADRKKHMSTEAIAAARVWTREALSVLAKCIMRYPPGFQNRWGMITTYMNDQLRPEYPYSQEECLAAAFKAAKNALPVAAAAESS